MVAYKVRIRFAKRGDLRLVSHLDLMRCLERVLRRARIPIALSQGFNPRPKMVFASALALGIEGRREVLDLELAEPVEPEELLPRLQAEAPPGLEFLEAEAVSPGKPDRPAVVHYALEVPADRLAAARAALAEFLASASWPYTRRRPDRTSELDLRPLVLGAELDPSGSFRFRLKLTPSGSARPEELLDELGLCDLLEQGSILARTEVELAPAP